MSDDVKILIVDDEEDILEFLAYNLSKEGYVIRTAKSGKKALKLVEEFMPELILLDIMMPEMDGIEFCTHIRENKDLNNILILFLTARDESFTQISALDSGGDDFLTKPVKMNVLKSKIKAIVRRHVRFQGRAEDSTIKLGDLIIDREKFQVVAKGKDVVLAKKEFDLLNLLISRPGKVFKRNEILDIVWGREVIVGDRTIDVHIRKLREKIGKGYIKTLKGVGYKFKY